MRLVGFAIYVAIGALFHVLFVGAQFDWHSAWTFAWLFGWPVMLFVTFWAVVLIGLFAVGLIWCAYSWLETIATWRARKRETK